MSIRTPSSRLFHSEQVLRFVRATVLFFALAYIINEDAKFRRAQYAEWDKVESYHKEAVAGRKQILSVQMENQKTLNEHIKAAIMRWREVPTLNPGFKVPSVAEPTLPEDSAGTPSD